MDINADAYAILNTQEFQGATRRDKPKFDEGTLVYCRVLSCDRLAKVQLSCISPLCKKSWTTGEAFFGKLDNGFVRDYPIGFCRGLLGESSYVLDKLGEKF
jgi:exosome complex component RRP40